MIFLLYFPFPLNRFKTASIYVLARLLPCLGIRSFFFLSFFSRRSCLVSVCSPFTFLSPRYQTRGEVQ